MTSLRPVLAGADCVLVPLANQHLDHKVARAAAERCVAPERLVYYEDLPYFAQLSPGVRQSTLREFVPPSTQVLMLVHPDGSGLKRELAACYPSQITFETLGVMAEYAKERMEQTGIALPVSNLDAGAEVVFAGSLAQAILKSFGAIPTTL